MLKLDWALIGAALLLPLAFPQLLGAQEAPEGDRLGVCNLYNLSGYAAIDSNGEIVNLMDYCHNFRQNQSEEVALRNEQRFWENFVLAADQGAIAFAETLGQEQVLAYGNTVCPFLKGGGSLGELRQVQADQDLPPRFDVAVTVAAIHTYCPRYGSEIGQSSF
ncbi:MAG: DUF732 domain-containing protein [Oculatellaceae cyanobacterium Prado106]|jgi:hypothetical protein|nr:DUF732 domain-containing protein [Oculatellaceae cyanobacterium Prado106]